LSVNPVSNIALQTAGIHLFGGRPIRRRNHVRAYYQRGVLLWKKTHRVALGAPLSVAAEGKSSSRMLVSARIEQVRCRLLDGALERR